HVTQTLHTLFKLHSWSSGTFLTSIYLRFHFSSYSTITDFDYKIACYIFIGLLHTSEILRVWFQTTTIKEISQ
uniref:Uncharacterized protein n=1 Tax=Apteryx owenii TaxID=8824 RepID=A0A8B9Q963_APTOW